MTEEEMFISAASMIPQWFSREVGHSSVEVNTLSQSYKAYLMAGQTDRLLNFLTAITEVLPKFNKAYLREESGIEEWVQQRCILQWLAMEDDQIKWGKVLKYVHSMTHRTYENSPVACNLVISTENSQTTLIPPTKHGTIDKGEYCKILDQIGASPFTYVAVDPEMNYLGYRSIDLKDVDESGQGGYHPEFLNQFASLLKKPGPYRYSIHLTSRRDIIMMDHIGMMCARRKGKWKAYDPKNFRKAIALALGPKSIGSMVVAGNLYEVLFDLSFRRHGALLIYDPDHRVVDQVVNTNCIIGPEQEDGIHRMLGIDINRMALGQGAEGLGSRKRLLIELASVDGAVIFDDTNILAFGAILKPNPNVKKTTGARSTAALSAYHSGGKPIKVSSDGEVTLYFTNQIDRKVQEFTFL